MQYATYTMNQTKLLLFKLLYCGMLFILIQQYRVRQSVLFETKFNAEYFTP